MDCPKRRAEKERIKVATGTRSILHPIRATTTPSTVRLGPPTVFKGDDGGTGVPVDATTKRRKIGRSSMASKFQTASVMPGESVAQTDQEKSIRGIDRKSVNIGESAE